MVQQNKTSIYTELSHKYNIPYQVVEVICNHPSNLLKIQFQMRKILSQLCLVICLRLN